MSHTGEIRVAGISYKFLNVARCRVSDAVDFVEDPENSRNSDALKVLCTVLGGDMIPIGFVPANSVSEVRRIIQLPRYRGATISHIGASMLEEGEGIRIGLVFSGKRPFFVIDCDCCITNCPTLLYEDIRYMD